MSKHKPSPRTARATSPAPAATPASPAPEAPDTGADAKAVAPDTISASPAGSKATVASATRSPDAAYSEILRSDLLFDLHRTGKPDEVCMLRLPGPFSVQAMKQHARFHAEVLGTVIELVDAAGKVLFRFEGTKPRVRTHIAPPDDAADTDSTTATDAETPAPKAKAAKSAPKANAKAKAAPPKAKAKAAPPKAKAAKEDGGEPRATKRLVSYEDLHRLALRKQGVTNTELTVLNGEGGNQPWKSYLSIVAKKHKMAVVTEKVDGTITHFLRKG